MEEAARCFREGWGISEGAGARRGLGGSFAFKSFLAATAVSNRRAEAGVLRKQDIFRRLLRKAVMS